MQARTARRATSIVTGTWSCTRRHTPRSSATFAINWEECWANKGFDPARDIVAITVNRWTHGYAYEYSTLWDPDFAPDERPCVIGRQPFGRITIANSDAGAKAYTDAAIDQAWRAVGEIKAG